MSIFDKLPELTGRLAQKAYEAVLDELSRLAEKNCEDTHYIDVDLEINLTERYPGETDKIRNTYRLKINDRKNSTIHDLASLHSDG